MTTTEHPQGAQLTRRQLRELQLSETGSISTDAAEPAGPVTPAAAPLPRAVDTVVPPAPSVSDDAHATDADGHRLTRRELREIERVRTASVPVIAAASPEPALADVPLLPEPAAAVPAPAAPVPASAPTPVFEAPESGVSTVTETIVEAPAEIAPKPEEDEVAAEPAPVTSAEQPRVAPTFGGRILADAPDDTAVTEESFDSLLGRGLDTSGSATSGHALILEDAALPPLTAPVTSNGETLLTGTFALPESLSSQGHAGAADGKDVDAVLIDGELPATSSPTPIAATAAVSQAKTPGEIIKPPAPEKSNKLMLALAITAGALAVTLGVVVVVAFLTGALTQ